jgi:hypothetical protein
MLPAAGFAYARAHARQQTSSMKSTDLGGIPKRSRKE